MALYADIVLPLAQPLYTYAVPEGMEPEPGRAVAVQFGPRKFHTGIVWRLHENPPRVGKVKSILKLLYPQPLLTPSRMKLWEWVADYYMCTLGEVMIAALPALMKPRADSEADFSDALFERRTEWFVTPAAEVRTEEGQALLDHLRRRAPKQYALMSEILRLDGEGVSPVPRRLLDVPLGDLRTLARRGLLALEERVPDTGASAGKFLLPQLSEHQSSALAEIRREFSAGRSTVLLQGVTSSGKTEVYIHLIAETLARGGDVLLLVPEIALTAQLIARLERIFGSRVTSYHSKQTSLQRAETFLRLNAAQGGGLVVGARSALFLPLNRLQLVIVDEEHDASYKQTEPNPRYNARDCAVMMARLFGGHTLLGSATPSLESWLNAESGKYGKASLRVRYGDVEPPEILLSDTLRAVKRGERHSHFNKLLLDRMEETLARGEQIMLFQNRRGFSPYVECTECGWTARCPHCNVTLTYHKGRRRLVCHYCEHSEPVPAHCPSCQVADVVPMGFGTEKIEAEVAALFPQAVVARLDRDCVTSERAFADIVRNFAEHRTDILVGTQMITKGFDFDGVALVGILNADNVLNNPDFRASERAYQLFTQVAGRAGRRARRGQVVIQTADPANAVLRQVREADFDAMARAQLQERAEFFYPPYVRMIVLTLRHRDVNLLRDAALWLANALRARFGRRVSGPMSPPVDRIRGEWLLDLLLKIECTASLQRARGVLREVLSEFSSSDSFRGVTLLINVDPQ